MTRIVAFIYDIYMSEVTTLTTETMPISFRAIPKIPGEHVLDRLQRLRYQWRVSVEEQRPIPEKDPLRGLPSNERAHIKRLVRGIERKADIGIYQKGNEWVSQSEIDRLLVGDYLRYKYAREDKLKDMTILQRLAYIAKEKREELSPPKTKEKDEKSN